MSRLSELGYGLGEIDTAIGDPSTRSILNSIPLVCVNSISDHFPKMSMSLIVRDLVWSPLAKGPFLSEKLSPFRGDSY